MERYRAMPKGVTITTWLGTHYLRHCRRHRFPGNFLIICLAPCENEKSPCSPEGTRTENTISAVPPCLPVKPTAHPAPTRRVPSNAGNASEDTKESSCSLCPRRPICCSAFRSPLSYGELSVDALAALLPRLWFALFACSLYTPSSAVCQALFFTERGQMCAEKNRTVNIP